ncbi:hypothetical protein CMUS01_06439 [Colletotrichum musicola]|uniref:Uncharacterized protein n=1 Tax=Colletotrichum musicola TaxID=2175873 RepID=A0A8H6NIE7_9PEZI|nr:hypothetical protein CMUS01_06439 [Colletotrichum musicola]
MATTRLQACGLRIETKNPRGQHRSSRIWCGAKARFLPPACESAFNTRRCRPWGLVAVICPRAIDGRRKPY